MAGKMRLQSAMEYLMTYGWAITMIAVVIVALYAFGVFNPATYEPRANPGSCQVLRPLGAGTITDVSFTGGCTGSKPEFVGQFDGKVSNVMVTSAPLLGFTQSFTITAWVKINGASTAGWPAVVSKGNLTSNNYYFGTWAASNQLYFTYYDGAWRDVLSGLTMQGGKWNFVAVSINSISENFYLNSQSASVARPASPILINANTLWIGWSGNNNGQNIYGLIANLQIYNSSLSSNQIQALYGEGIGGIPIRLQNLVGWWPLNGDANDYSGNNNNGATNNIVFNSGWYYTFPN